MAAPNITNKYFGRTASWNGRRYTDPNKVPVEPVAGLIFSDDFASGDLSKTGGGFAWGGSNNAAVVGNKLRLSYAASSTIAEQRFTLGATQYLNLWIKYDLYVSPTYNHQLNPVTPSASNNKGHIMLWSNSTGSRPFDGYSQPDEMLMSIELDPHSNADGGSFLAPRCQSLDAAGTPIVDYNGSNESICPNGIVVADIGATRQVIIRIKASTIPWTGDQYNWSSVGNGAVQMWKDGTKIWERLDANIYKDADWDGFNRGYLFGARDAVNPVADYLEISNFEIATANLWGVS